MTKPKVKKVESAEKLRRMRAVYETGQYTLAQVGAQFGMTRQAVQERFKRAGISRREAKRSARRLDCEPLRELYEIHCLTMTAVARELRTTVLNVAAELGRCGITIRSRGAGRRKLPALYEMKAGETISIKSFPVKNIYRTLHSRARTAGIRISVRKTGDETFEIKRMQ